MPKVLTAAQIEQFRAQGYIKGIKIFDEDKLQEIGAKFHAFTAELKSKGLTHNDVNGWFAMNRYYFSICQTPKILDCLEDLLGPNLLIWGGQFFAKEPRDSKTVPWHQDAQYWPLHPREPIVSVWLAIFNADRENGCMQVIPGSHQRGVLPHGGQKAASDVLQQVLSPGAFDPSEAVDIDLKAGEMSLHTDAMIHGSGPNHSDRWRCGMTMRVSSDEVKVDLQGWPHFRWILLRGEDRYHHNPRLDPPSADIVPTGYNQFGRERLASA